MCREFIPCTMERHIGNRIYFRPIKSWHTGVYAGEKLYKIPGTNGGSGCLRRDTGKYQDLCSPPLTVTHRLYWHEKNKDKTISAFLSYPNGMGAMKEYFWEIYPAEDGDIERFVGDKAEEEMEEMIKRLLVNGIGVVK